MKLRRAIAISLVAHAAFLVCAHLRIDPTGGDLEIPSPTDSLTSRFVHVEARLEQSEQPEAKDRKKREILEMNLAAGLDGRRQAETEPPESEGERPEQSKPKVAQKKKPDTDSSDQSKSESDEPSSRRAPETAETSKEANEPRGSTTPEPVVANNSESEVETTTEASPPANGRGEQAASRNTGGRAGASGDSEDEGAAKGSSGSTGEPRADVDRGKLLRGYARKLYERLARHKRYPNAARRAGIEGKVVVEIRIDAEGHILEVEIAESSGHGTLDRAALETVRSLERLPEPPHALAWNEKRLQVPIRYKLNKRG